MGLWSRRYGCLPSWVEWVIGLGMVAVMVVLLWPVSGPRHPHIRHTPVAACITNEMFLVTAAKVYAQDNEGRLPSNAQWPDCWEEYLDQPDVLTCPARAADPLPHYALGPAVEGKKVADLGPADQVVLIYEVDAFGAPVFPHRGFANYAFLNGDVQRLADPPEGSGLLKGESE